MHAEPKTHWVIGRNSVSEVLKNLTAKDIVRAVVLKQKKGGDSRFEDLLSKLRSFGLKVDFLEKAELDRLVSSESHQGVALEISPQNELDLKGLIDLSQAKESSIVLVLDEIQDPQNLGTILRAAECFGVDAVVWSQNRGASLSPAVSKASAGASEICTKIIVSNVAEALRKLKKHDFWVVACESREHSVSLSDFEFPKKVAIVMGSEGKGIRHLLSELADYSVKIPMFGQIDSLNVSQACAVILYAARKG